MKHKKVKSNSAVIDKQTQSFLPQSKQLQTNFSAEAISQCGIFFTMILDSKAAKQFDLNLGCNKVSVAYTMRYNIPMLEQFVLITRRSSLMQIYVHNHQYSTY